MRPNNLRLILNSAKNIELNVIFSRKLHKKHFHTFSIVSLTGLDFTENYTLCEKSKSNPHDSYSSLKKVLFSPRGAIISIKRKEIQSVRNIAAAPKFDLICRHIILKQI